MVSGGGGDGAPVGVLPSSGGLSWQLCCLHFFGWKRSNQVSLDSISLFVLSVLVLRRVYKFENFSIVRK